MPEFSPPRRFLMGPGPAPVYPQVLAATARPTIGHLDPAFVALMDDVQQQLRTVFGTANAYTVPISAPATAAMEACMINVLEPGDRALVCVNGVFGTRLAEMGRRCGAEVDTLDFPWGRAVDPDTLRQHLASAAPYKLVAWVQAETSTGVLSDSATLAGIVREQGALSLVDCVTAIGGVPIEVDAWGLDMVYAGSQKCLSAPPGLAPITVGERALAALRERRSPPQSWFVDFNLLGGYWGDSGGRRAYHHTAPVNAIYGLHEALRLLLEGGLDEAHARHRASQQALIAGLEPLGIEPIPPREERLPPLTTIGIPEGIDDAAFRAALLHGHDLEIGAGLGDFAGRAWRIGLMGHGSNGEAVERCLRAIAAELSAAGKRVSVDEALAAAAAAAA